MVYFLLQNRIPVRGDPHILVVGDPGLGKSQVCYLFTGDMDMEMIVAKIMMIKVLHIFLSNAKITFYKIVTIGSNEICY